MTSEPLLIVGAGIAGIATALAAAPTPVLLLNRSGGARRPASTMAQGGIAAALGPGDAAQAHARDTLIAGAYYNDPAMVHWLCAQAPATIAWLERQGVAFDRDADGALQLGREGGHGQARIVHAGGDATGARLMQALRERAQAAAHIHWQDDADVEALLLRGAVVAGVRTRSRAGDVREIEARGVVLATGGIGAAFARSSNPPGADGAGLALGMAAGARVRDLEFVQFHPTALDLPGARSLPLITEALRGAGARLHDDGGRAVMAAIDPRGDLAPRDIVARTVWRAQQTGRRIFLDASTVTGDWAQRFPTVLAACLEHGIDPRRQPIPITPAAHFHMGGLATDFHGNTSIAGLYAVGEAACNGVHGANRLASNSLLEGVACGRRLGAALAMRAHASATGPARWSERGPGLPDGQREALRGLLWDAAGPVRNGTQLAAAWRHCQDAGAAGWQMRLAAALLGAALDRRASLGAHWREDAQTPAILSRMAQSA